MPDLFDADPTHAPGSRRAPADLNPAQWARVREWADTRCPWISRGALGSLTPVEEYVDACLTFFRQRKTLRVDWADTVISWIRNDERKRLERMANGGSESARLALRDPVAWRLKHDRTERMTAPSASSAPTILNVPTEPARVISLSARRRA